MPMRNAFGWIDLVTVQDLYSGTTILPHFFFYNILCLFFGWVLVELTYHMALGLIFRAKVCGMAMEEWNWRYFFVAWYMRTMCDTNLYRPKHRHTNVSETTRHMEEICVVNIFMRNRQQQLKDTQLRHPHDL